VTVKRTDRQTDGQGYTDHCTWQRCHAVINGLCTFHYLLCNALTSCQLHNVVNNVIVSNISLFVHKLVRINAVQTLHRRKQQ